MGLFLRKGVSWVRRVVIPEPARGGEDLRWTTARPEELEEASLSQQDFWRLGFLPEPVRSKGKGKTKTTTTPKWQARPPGSGAVLPRVDVTGHATDPARQEMTERQKRARRAQIALYRHRIFVDDPAQVLQCVPHLQ